MFFKSHILTNTYAKRFKKWNCFKRMWCCPFRHICNRVTKFYLKLSFPPIYVLFDTNSKGHWLRGIMKGWEQGRDLVMKIFVKYRVKIMLNRFQYCWPPVQTLMFTVILPGENPFHLPTGLPSNGPLVKIAHFWKLL